MPSGMTRSLATCQPAPSRTSTTSVSGPAPTSRAKAARISLNIAAFAASARNHTTAPVAGRTKPYTIGTILRNPACLAIVGSGIDAEDDLYGIVTDFDPADERADDIAPGVPVRGVQPTSDGGRERLKPPDHELQ